MKLILVSVTLTMSTVIFTSGPVAAQPCCGGMQLVQADPLGDKTGGAQAKPSRVKVIEWQKALKDRGYDPGRVDGSVGLKTRSAIGAFQKYQGLKPTGDCDIETARKLGVRP